MASRRKQVLKAVGIRTGDARHRAAGPRGVSVGTITSDVLERRPGSVELLLCSDWRRSPRSAFIMCKERFWAALSSWLNVLLLQPLLDFVAGDAPIRSYLERRYLSCLDQPVDRRLVAPQKIGQLLNSHDPSMPGHRKAPRKTVGSPPSPASFGWISSTRPYSAAAHHSAPPHQKWRASFSSPDNPRSGRSGKNLLPSRRAPAQMAFLRTLWGAIGHQDGSQVRWQLLLRTATMLSRTLQSI